MTNISDILDIGELTKLIVDGQINVTHHPSLPLRIYNYSKTASYVFRGKENWPNAAIQCRGLIVDDDDLIVSRPFPKFFGMQEHSRSDIVFSKPFTVSDKMDGSLGILYYCYQYPGEKVILGDYHGPRRYAIATRGSFTSEQAIKATEILDLKYGHIVHDMNEFDPAIGCTDGMHDLTFLFEIIYPQNRIVVDYGKTEDLVLLAIIDNVTGKDLPLPVWKSGSDGFPVVKEYDSVDYKPREILEKLGVNDGATEGFVLKFDWPKDGTTRVKVKYDEYMRLHKIVTGVSNKTVWEHLSGGLSFDELMDRVPDEFNEWLKSTIADLQGQFDEILNEAKLDLVIIQAALEVDGDTSRKNFARMVSEATYKALIFLLLDDDLKKVHQLIWKMIRPEYAKPFSKDIDH